MQAQPYSGGFDYAGLGAGKWYGWMGKHVCGYVCISVDLCEYFALRVTKEAPPPGMIWGVGGWARDLRGVHEPPDVHPPLRLAVPGPHAPPPPLLPGALPAPSPRGAPHRPAGFAVAHNIVPEYITPYSDDSLHCCLQPNSPHIRSSRFIKEPVRLPIR